MKIEEKKKKTVKSNNSGITKLQLKLKSKILTLDGLVLPNSRESREKAKATVKRKREKNLYKSKQGENSSGNKLTELQLLVDNENSISLKDISIKYGLLYSDVKRIKNKNLWKPVWNL